MAGMSPNEVCRVYKKFQEEGHYLLREISFLIDRSTQQRITEMHSTGETLTSGWKNVGIRWPDMAKLMGKIHRMERNGWTIVWGKGYGPEPNLNDYIKIVDW